ncbi:hypothetical protein AAFF_G00414920 [Aldrovandia affinis]|uniref:Uncharacterized protein n=1 Tax=Aldrovandia affinis TaxID=143900 RepID=A0AAD7SB25_9TELE|nr:hypothetical protein AAFF_G00414920 [Aldrovandia affinis]
MLCCSITGKLIADSDLFRRVYPIRAHPTAHDAAVFCPRVEGRARRLTIAGDPRKRKRAFLKRIAASPRAQDVVCALSSLESVFGLAKLLLKCGISALQSERREAKASLKGHSSDATGPG